jgi:hypothetical protein
MAEVERFELTPQQKTFFETFGFLRLRGLFAPDVERISRAFDDVFTARAQAESDAAGATDGGIAALLPGEAEAADHESVSRAIEQTQVVHTHEHLNFQGHRAILPWFLEICPGLQWLKDDPRVVGTVAGLLGEDFEYFGSDGNILDCDTCWHWDAYNAPLEVLHLKLLFYLDPLDATNGAIRVLPGTSHYEDAYPTALRPSLYDRDRAATIYGVGPTDIPGYTIENEPGDMVVISFRTIHATFNSGEGRRLFTVNYRERSPLAPPNPYAALENAAG